ncbi:hypothetical protein NUU61_005205 [Penicillium alfredii]|uniref:Spindle assembly checkpoint component MAD1 n=1 Tax=Penicillium alfredii TaxID=1506179 RepID=A0A9W9K7D7_9EURO|nr:uncharacterized protein NUU61_005205 [Penicillium alfredii]KAJ5095849.1 hypothetical protein NUU61_005205 [Penicillium alfredii]
MDTRQPGKKRKISTGSDSRSQSPVSHRTRQGLAPVLEQSLDPKAASYTPRKPRKKVRFSDPGPRLHDVDVGSTGLTPAMHRTSFNEASLGSSRSGDRTPTRRGRRRSAPIPRYLRCSFDPVSPYDETCTERVMQFTPLRQILDTRTQRRIRRTGLSDEINHIERQKRETANFDRSLQTLIQERDTLKHELNTLRQNHTALEDQSSAAEAFWLSPQVRLQELEAEMSRLRDEISVCSNHSLDDRISSANGDGDTFTLNDSAVLVSNSPDLRGTIDSGPPISDSLALFGRDANAHDSTEPTAWDKTGESDIHALSLDLEAARKEKKDLFHACRSRISGLNDPTLSGILRQPSPPPDFFDSVLDILTMALSRASDATSALEGINQECSTLGFAGTDADDAITDIRSHFRSARLELERALPGETAGIGLEDGKATLSELVRRVASLTKDLGTERKHHHGSLGREKALRGQFDTLLHRYESAANKIGGLEESITSSASDMLHTRMRMHDLEREGQEQAIGIDRLNAALKKYRDDVKGLEELVSTLERENLVAKDESAQQISDLKLKLADERRRRSAVEASASGNDSRIRELEETLEQNRIRVCDLTAQVESLEKEHQRAVERLDQKAHEQLQHHEEEAGTLNVRISNLTTTLEETRFEARRLRQVTAGLEEQLQLEIEARNDLLDKWAADQACSFAYMKDVVRSERRRSKVRAANWELKSDDIMSDGTTPTGSEPITPVSMTRFVDVEVGRGKNRRRMDSGIGILSEEELLEREDISELRRGLDSDIDLPTSDLM